MVVLVVMIFFSLDSLDILERNKIIFWQNLLNSKYSKFATASVVALGDGFRGLWLPQLKKKFV